jgi:hypothetical protein
LLEATKRRLIKSPAMKTFLLSVVLIISGLFAWRISIFVLNIAGLPGALVAWRTSDKSQTLGSALRFGLGVMISTLGQSYVYLGWVAVVVNFTKHESGTIYGPVIWSVAFITSFFPVYLSAAAGVGEAAAGESEWNPQVYAVLYTEILAVIGFFIFAFFPSVIAVGWPWATYVSHWWGWS